MDKKKIKDKICKFEYNLHTAGGRLCKQVEAKNIRINDSKATADIEVWDETKKHIYYDCEYPLDKI